MVHEAHELVAREPFLKQSFGKGLPDPVPELQYTVCDPCLDGDHGGCRGLISTEELCGCRCPWLEHPGVPFTVPGQIGLESAHSGEVPDGGSTMTDSPTEPTAAEEQAKADHDLAVAQGEETLAGDLARDEAADAAVDADNAALAAELATQAREQTAGTAEPAPDVAPVATPSPEELAGAPANVGSQPDPSAPAPEQPASTSSTDSSPSPESSGPPTGTDTSFAPPTPEPSSAGQESAPAPSAGSDTLPGSDAATDGSAASDPAPDVGTGAYVAPDVAEQTAFVDTPTASAPFDPSSGGGAVDATASPDPSVGYNSHAGAETPSQDAEPGAPVE